MVTVKLICRVVFLRFTIFFRRADLNNDGKISVEEILKLFEVNNVKDKMSAAEYWQLA